MSASVTRGYALTAIMKLSTRFTCTVKWVLLDVLCRILLQICWHQFASVELLFGHILFLLSSHLIGFYSSLLAGWKTSTSSYCFQMSSAVWAIYVMMSLLENLLMGGKTLTFSGFLPFLFVLLGRKIALFCIMAWLWVIELWCGIPCGDILITCWLLRRNRSSWRSDVAQIIEESSSDYHFKSVTQRTSLL